MVLHTLCVGPVTYVNKVQVIIFGFFFKVSFLHINVEICTYVKNLPFYRIFIISFVCFIRKCRTYVVLDFGSELYGTVRYGTVLYSTVLLFSKKIM